MAKSDVLVRMKADTSNYDANIAKARKQLDGFKKDNLSMGGVMKQTTGMLVSAAAKFATLGAACQGAMKIMKDTFNASEAAVDSWGRTMQSANSLYDGFLTSINTGDISGFLSRIDQIVAAARAAYDEMDRLGTMKTIQSPAMSAQQTENERMRMMIQTGHYIAPLDGRRASMKNGQLLTADQIRNIERQLNGGMQKMLHLVGNEVHQTGKAIDALFTSQAADLGMSLKEFRSGTSSMEEFDKRMEGYKKYLAFEAAHSTTITSQGSAGAMVQRVRDNVANPYADFAKWGVFRVDGERYNQLVQLIQQRNQQAGQAYGMQSQAYRTMNRAEGVTVRSLMQGEGGGGGGRSGGGGRVSGVVSAVHQTEMQQNQTRINELTQEYVSISDQATEEVRLRQEAIREEIALLERRNNLLKLYEDQAHGKLLGGNVETPTSANVSGSDLMKIGDGLGKDFKLPVKQAVDGGKEVEKSWKSAASAASSFGSALSGIDDPAAKIAGTIAQAVANIALAFSSADMKDGETGNVWYWIAATAAGVATMISTISTIRSATGYAQGGIIKGNSYSGDNIMANGGTIGLNAGEVVLTKAMQGNLASQLADQNRGLQIVGVVKGESLVLVSGAYRSRTGHATKGERLGI